MLDFPSSFRRSGAAPDELHQALRDRLNALADSRVENPRTNAVQQLAHELARKIDHGELALSDIEGLIRRLVGIAFVERAERLGVYIGEADPALNDGELARLFRHLAGTVGGRPSLSAFRAAIESRPFGIVMTAHPTFGVTAELMRVQAKLAIGRDGDGTPLEPGTRKALVERALSAEHGPDPNLDLAVEHAMALDCLDHALCALRRAHACALRVAAELFPKDWRTLRPGLVTVATWVGYDLDGRADIKWHDVFYRRIELRHHQIQRYRQEAEALLELMPDPGGRAARRCRDPRARSPPRRRRARSRPGAERLRLGRGGRSRRPRATARHNPGHVCRLA